MTILPIASRCAGLSFAGFFACSFVIAQVAPSQSPSPASEEVVTLSAFEVSGEAPQGYGSTSAMTASRIAVPITELPSTVIVINQKLIDDTVATSIGDTLNFIAGVNKGNQGTGTQDQNQLAMRGYEVGGAQRDGVSDRLISAAGGFDYAFIERLEVVKGPSGVFYGNHSPGGIINFVSKRPLATPRTRISTTIGSWDTWRIELDTSGFFDSEKKFGYRLATAFANTEGVNRFAGDPSGGIKVYNPSLSYQFDNGLRVWAWAAIVRDQMNRIAHTAHAYRTGPRTGRVLFKEAELSGNNIYSNLTEVNSDNFELGATHSFQLGPVQADLRGLARKYERDSDGSRIRGIGPGVDIFLDAQNNVLGSDSRFTDYAVVDQSLARVARRQVRFDSRFNTTEGYEYGLDMNLRFALGPTKSNLLLYGAYGTSDDIGQDNVYDITNNAVLLSLGFETIPNGFVLTTGRPDPTFRPDPRTVIDNANIVNIRNLTFRDDTTYSIGAIERLTFLNDRAILVGGIRLNKIETLTAQTVGNQLINPNRSDDRTTTSSLAGLYKVYTGDAGTVSLFYNKNETFTPVFTLDRRLATFGERFPNRIAETDEFGAKADLFNGKLAVTLSIFDTTQNNGLQSFADEDGSVTGNPISTYQAPTGLRNTKGWEVDVNLSPRPGWDMIVSYGDIEAKLESGVRVEAIPEKTFSVLSRYQVQSGALRGASAAWIYNYWGKSLLGSRTNWELPSGDLHSLVLGYSRPQDIGSFRGRWSVRLRIENVFDRPAALPATFETAVGVTKPRNYRLGLSYEF